MKLDFERLQRLLRRRADDSEVTALIGCKPQQIVRLAYEGYVDLKDEGVSVMFKEAPWVVPEEEIIDSKALHLAAFHFHREGHEGHAGYLGKFPDGAIFGDSGADLVRKLGHPSATGGGGISTVLKKPIPYWFRYTVGDAMLQFQLDADGEVELVTLYTQDLKQQQQCA